MTDWFERAFGVAASEFGQEVSDVRAKLIDEAWFSRRVPESRLNGDLGWTRADDAGGSREATAQTHLADPDRTPPSEPTPEQDIGIDR